MNRDDEITLYGKRAARTVARFRLDDPEEIRKADEKVQQWTPWAYRYTKFYLKGNPKILYAAYKNGWGLKDVYQAALYGMSKASRTHTGKDGAFSAWAVWDMRKEIQRLAVRKSVGTVPLPDKREDYTALQVDESTPEPIEPAVKAEEIALGRSLLERLPSPYREIVVDHFSGVIQDETIARIGVSKRTLRKYRTQAMEWLQFFAGVGPKPEKELPGMTRYRGTGDDENELE